MTPTAWAATNYRAYPRRGSGFWLSYTCQGTNGSSTTVTPWSMWTYTAYTSAGVRDTTVAHVGSANALSSTGQCFLIATVADPTAPATEPELYIVRTETDVLNAGQCSGSNVNVAATNVTGYSILEIASNGTTTTQILASAGDSSDGQLSGRIDPGGRLVLFNTNLADTSKMTIRRLKSDGTLDTTIGTAGIVTINIGAAPAGQASVSASATGIITTPTKVYFAVMLSDRTSFTTQCASSAQFTWGWRMAVVSPSDGILSIFGTAGVGGRVSVTAAESIGCTGTVGGGNGVDTTGTPRMIRFDNGVTKLDKWEAPVGTNGGGDGGTGSGGATTDTGGAPSTGDGLGIATPTTTTSTTSTTTTTVAPIKTPIANIDNTVYSKKLPARITASTAIQVLTDAQSKTEVLTTRTPEVCLTLTTSIVVTGTGTCTVRVLSKADKTTLRTLTSKSSTKATTVGTTITASDPLKFSIVSWKLSAASKAQISKLAETANTASRVLVVGHTGMLFENEAANQHISTFRAAAVKAALQKAGVKTPFSVVGMGSRVPLTTTKTESAQAKNRRVVLYFFP